MKIDFKGQIVLVTGATRGIGKTIADDLLGLGAKLILTGNNKTQVDALNKEAKMKRLPKKYYAVDFSKRENLISFLDIIKEKYKRIDVCINNAGINRIGFIEEAMTEDWDDIMAVNLEAPFMLTRGIGNIMKRNGYGRIVNISSIFGIVSKAKRSIYSISKFGIRGLTVSSAIDFAPHNILVNTVSPGFVDTELTRRVLGEAEMKKMAKQIPLGRLAVPSDISSVVTFLSSRLNTYITGQNIIVDGGFVNV